MSPVNALTRSSIYSSIYRSCLCYFSCLLLLKFVEEEFKARRAAHTCGLITIPTGMQRQEVCIIRSGRLKQVTQKLWVYCMAE